MPDDRTYPLLGYHFSAVGNRDGSETVIVTAENAKLAGNALKDPAMLWTTLSIFMLRIPIFHHELGAKNIIIL